jgi:hypothetical protein
VLTEEIIIAFIRDTDRHINVREFIKLKEKESIEEPFVFKDEKLHIGSLISLIIS